LQQVKEVEKVRQELEILKSIHAKDMERFRTEITKSAAAVVFQARINLAAKATDPDFDKSSWDVEG
jgi:hypothetical protein